MEIETDDPDILASEFSHPRALVCIDVVVIGRLLSSLPRMGSEGSEEIQLWHTELEYEGVVRMLLFSLGL